MKNDKTSRFNKVSGSDDGRRWDEGMPKSVPVDDPRNDVSNYVTPDLIQIPTKSEYDRNNDKLDELRKKIGGTPASPAKAPKRHLPN